MRGRHAARAPRSALGGTGEIALLAGCGTRYFRQTLLGRLHYRDVEQAEDGDARAYGEHDSPWPPEGAQLPFPAFVEPIRPTEDEGDYQPVEEREAEEEHLICLMPLGAFRQSKRQALLGA
jgi:hypothetical protein